MMGAHMSQVETCGDRRLLTNVSPHEGNVATVTSISLPPCAMLERLIYQSQASHEFGSLHLFNLLTEARLRNQRLQITGHLLYFEGRFTQCIEGPTASIDQLWQSLQRDDRHHDVQLLGRYAIEERRFPEWTMAFSSYQSLYVHGMTGFFPVDDGGDSPLVTICSSPSEASGDTEVCLQHQG